MTRPGVEVRSRADRPRRGAPTDTGVLFVAGITQRGVPSVPTRVSSFAQFVDAFGPRQSYSVLADSLETFFAEGGAEAQVVRVVGPAAVKASRNLTNSVAANSVKVEAIGPGDYANSFTVEVVLGSGADLRTLIIRDGATELERFVDVDKAASAVVAALATSRYVRGTNMAAPAPDVAVQAAAALAGGTDDRASITDAHYTAALALFTRNLGPGQVALPGRTTVAAHTSLLAHARDNNRTALLDAADASNEAALTALVGPVRVLPGSEHGGLFGFWVTIPGASGSTSTRTVPGSAFVAGLIARNDGSDGPNGAPAGDRGVARFALDVSGGALTDAARGRLTELGVNLARIGTAGVQLYGFRSVTTDAAWKFLTWQRLRMWHTARLQEVGEGFLFRDVDGRGALLAEMRGALLGVLAEDYAADRLFGETPEDAFDVDVSDGVNTPTTLEAGDVYAVAWARYSPFAELVRIDLVKAAVSALTA